MTSAKETNLAAQERMGALINAHDVGSLGEVFATDVVDHDPAPDQPAGLEGIQSFWLSFLNAFPDLAIEPAAVVADDEHVTVVLDITGTHTGDFNGHAPTGNSFAVRGIQVGRFEDGKLAERWGSTDEAGILKQLGLA
jgi:steroid delta-isomerase-like uncharacterized protein